MNQRIYIFSGDKEEVRKLINFIDRTSGMNYHQTNTFFDDYYCSFTLSDKLSRKVKLVNIDKQNNGYENPKNLKKIANFMSKSKSYKTEKEFNIFFQKIGRGSRIMTSDFQTRSGHLKRILIWNPKK